MKQTLLMLLGLLFLTNVAAEDAFVVEDIRVDGLQRIAVGTVFNYLPLKRGDTLDAERSAEAIRTLFATGFFRDVRLQRDGGLLIVTVAERPAIAAIRITGNDAIETQQLTDGLKQVGLAEGRIFNRSLLDKVERELRRQYNSLGKYAAEIETTVTPLERNRSAIAIHIREGDTARIRRVSIFGNQAFPTADLLDLFSLNTAGMLTRLTGSDQYSREKLAADLEKLASWYMDRGYFRFKIDSTQVTVSPDQKDIYISINITEGLPYTVSEIQLAGETALPEEALKGAISIAEGDLFSRKEAVASREAIAQRLGNEGYAFATINLVPDADDNQRQVALAFVINPGKRVYVERINITGNTRTRDEVVRRELRQFEGGRFSAAEVARSETRLRKLGYFEEVSVQTRPVPGVADQVNLTYKVSERSTGNIRGGVGYSQTQGLVLNASVSQDNFWGTGKRVSLDFNNSDVDTTYGFNFLDPYFTEDGVSMEYGMRYQKTDSADNNVTVYSFDSIGGAVDFGIPLNEFDRFYVGFHPRRIMNAQCGSDSGKACTDLIEKEGDSFDIFGVVASWSNDTRNQLYFPTQGLYQRLEGEATLPGGLGFFKVGYQARYYYPLGGDYAVALRGQYAHGYDYDGSGSLPFFERYYAGGISTVRGYKANTLGPRENNKAVGGSLRTNGSVELVMPVPFLKNSKAVRVSGFMDLGNTFESASDFDIGELRSSVGLMTTWISPIGPLVFSLAKPLNEKSGDESEVFQFELGRLF